MSGFLDRVGLSYFWGKVKSALAEKQDISSAVTMEQVSAAISAAVTGAIQEVYDGTDGGA